MFHLKNHHPPSLVPSSEQFSVLIELDTRNNVSCNRKHNQMKTTITLHQYLPSVTLSSNVPFTWEKHH